MGLFTGLKAKKEAKAEKKGHIAEIVKLRGRIYTLSYDFRVTDCITTAGAISADTVKEMLTMPPALLESDLLGYSLDDICELKKQFELSLQLSQEKQENQKETSSFDRWFEKFIEPVHKNTNITQKVLLIPKELTYNIMSPKIKNLEHFDSTQIRTAIEQYTKEFFGKEKANKIFSNLDNIACFWADIKAPASSSAILSTLKNTTVQVKCCLFNRLLDMLDPYNIDNAAHELYHNANSDYYFYTAKPDVEYYKAGCRLAKLEKSKFIYDFGNAMEECVAGAFGVYASQRYCEQTGKTRSWNGYFGTKIATCVEQFALLKEQNTTLYEEILDMAFEDDFELYLQKRDNLGIGFEAVGLTPRQQKIRHIFTMFDESFKLRHDNKRNAKLFTDIDYRDI